MERWRTEDRGFETPCWIWTRGRSGVYGCWARPGRTRLAHRAVYEDVRGVRLDPKVKLHHRCEVKLCVNPDHMREVTAGQHIDLHRSQFNVFGSGAWRAWASARAFNDSSEAA